METANSTLENNKLIAEFMQLPKYSINEYLFDENKIISNDSLKYHIKWNWLMPVVEKIEKVSHVTEFTIFGDSRGYYQCTIRQYTDSGRKERVNIECDSKIEAVYIACVEFIKWYNENN